MIYFFCRKTRIPSPAEALPWPRFARRVAAFLLPRAPGMGGGHAPGGAAEGAAARLWHCQGLVWGEARRHGQSQGGEYFF